MGKQTQQSEIGMVGLGVMGRNFVLNMADHGFAVAGYDKDPNKSQLCPKSQRNAMSAAPRRFRNSLRCFENRAPS